MAGAALVLAAADLSWLGQAIFVLVVVLGPLWERIRKARAAALEAARKAEARDTAGSKRQRRPALEPKPVAQPTAPAPTSGREVWEALLRGAMDVPEAPPTATPPKPVVVPQPPVRSSGRIKIREETEPRGATRSARRPGSNELPAAVAAQATAWRRAFVLTEVLGTPLALRGPSGPGSPPGLR